MLSLAPFRRAALAVLTCWLPLAWSAPASNATVPAGPAIYHDGWIDFNKDSVRDIYEDAARPAAERIADLLARMTLEEKTAQMVTLYGYPRVLQDERPTPAWRDRMWKDGIGNIDEQANGNEGWNGELPDPATDLPWSRHTAALNDIQRWFIENTRLGIPVDFTNEGIRGPMHSRATGFPAQLAVASTWDAPLVRAIGRVTGREARALGYTNIYSPVLDVARDPRWGRIIESYGESPFLVGELGLQQVLGLQEEGVAATLKHFAVYGIPKGGRDGHARTDPQATWNEVRTLYLEPFRKAIERGHALGVMASYNDYDSVPIEASARFLQQILRDEWGFAGYVVSDSGAVEFLHQKHRTAATPAEAIRQAVAAGLNIRTNFTAPEDYVIPLRQLVKDGAIPMTTIDARVRDILRVKFRLGLFDRPYREAAAAESIVRAPEHLAVAARAARESIILLKNDGALLPLKMENLKRVLITGPLADDGRAWWSRYGAQRQDYLTPLRGLRAALGNACEVTYVKGTEAADEHWPESDVYKRPMTDAVRAGIAAAVEAAREADVIIACLGETDAQCRESRSRISLDLPGYQEDLLRALHATGKPVVLVLSNGRPLTTQFAAREVPAILEMWFPGEDGGAALADVILGRYNPAGRLPVTVPQSVGQLPYNFPTRPGAQDADDGQVAGPLFAFGHGLSYTTFAYGPLTVTPPRALASGEVTVSFDLTNTGPVAGDEVAQLYLRDDYSSVTTFERRLVGFQRVPLQPGETRRITFTLGAEALRLYNAAGQWVVEPGRFTVFAGASSADIRQTATFVVTDANGNAPEEAPLPATRADPI